MLDIFKVARKRGLKTLFRSNGAMAPEALKKDECEKGLIRRTHFAIMSNYMEEGKCKFWGQEIPGIWQ